MEVVIQRVRECKVVIEGNLHSKISEGLILLLGIQVDDSYNDVDYLINKILKLRIFSDEDGKMNRNVSDINGEIMLISQFTLLANTNKGNRPSFLNAAKPTKAIPLYEYMVSQLNKTSINIKTGEFGAYMIVQLINDGPVTILMSSKNKK